MTIHIRLAQQTDVEELARIAAATFPPSCPPETPAVVIDAFIAKNLTATRFSAQLADPTRKILLATDDEQPAGYSRLIFDSPEAAAVQALVRARPTAELVDFFVLIEHHGQVAERLMAASIETATVRGTRSMWLGVHVGDEKTNAFYEKHGFREVGTAEFVLGNRTFGSDTVRERVL